MFAANSRQLCPIACPNCRHQQAQSRIVILAYIKASQSRISRTTSIVCRAGWQVGVLTDTMELLYTAYGSICKASVVQSPRSCCCDACNGNILDVSRRTAALWLQHLLNHHTLPLSLCAGTPIGDSQPLLVTDFRSQDDFITAAITSSFIPLWSGSGLFRLFRGLPAFDGGWTMSQPCPPDVKYCIRISSRNPSWPQNRGIGGFLSMIGRVGNSYTESSNTESGATPKKRAAKIVSTGPNGQPDLALVQLAAQNNMDIAPGVFHRVPFTQSQWSDWALSPAENINLISMYELGKADAAAWVEYVGIGQGVEGGAARETQGGTAMGGKGITKESKAQQAAEKPVRKLLK